MSAEDKVEAIAGDQNRYSGTVKKLIPGSAQKPPHGFIECADTFTMFGRDVFLHDQLVCHLTVGQPVSFGVGLNAKGMPQAIDVNVEGLGGNSEVPTPERVCEVLYPEVAAALQSGMKGPVAASLIAAAEGLGISKELRSQLGSPGKGSWDGGCGGFGKTGGKGKACAGCGDAGWGCGGGCWSGGCGGCGSCGGCWGDDGWGGCGCTGGCGDAWGGACCGKGCGGGGWGGGDAWGCGGQGCGKGGFGPGACGEWGKGGRPGPYGGKGQSGSGGKTMPAMDGQQGPFEGVVKSISSPKGSGGPPYGFVECEDTRIIYGRDVFLHSQQAGDLEVGVKVSFEVVLNQRGMPQATNLTKLS